MAEKYFENINDMMTAVRETAESESSGRGNIVAKCRVSFGFPVFVEGMKPLDRFFEAPPGKQNEQLIAAAKQTAIQFAKDNNYAHVDKIRFALQLTYFTDGAKKLDKDTGEVIDAGWKSDLAEVAGIWTMQSGEPSALGDVYIPALEELSLMHGSETWVQLGFKNDPYKVSLGEIGKTDTDLDGQDRYPTVRYPVQTFKDADAAYSWLNDVAAGAPDATFPASYGTADAWENVLLKMIQPRLAKDEKPEDLAAEFEVDVKYIVAAE